MNSLTRTPHGVVSGRRQGRSRRFTAYQARTAAHDRSGGGRRDHPDTVAPAPPWRIGHGGGPVIAPNRSRSGHGRRGVAAGNRRFGCLGCGHERCPAPCRSGARAGLLDPSRSRARLRGAGAGARDRGCRQPEQCGQRQRTGGGSRAGGFDARRPSPSARRRRPRPRRRRQHPVLQPGGDDDHADDPLLPRPTGAKPSSARRQVIGCGEREGECEGTGEGELRAARRRRSRSPRAIRRSSARR